MSAPSSVVVVGAGQAGASLVQTLRGQGYRGPITLIGAEPELPYQRPPLSKKYLLGALSAERLALKPPSYYAEAEVVVRPGTEVRGIDRAAQEVVLCDETRLPYGALALTTGAPPRLLPASVGGALDGVFAMRTKADADRLAPEIAPQRQALVVGGGYIGLEAAAVFAQKQMRVTMLQRGPRLLNRVACAETAAFLADLHRSHGVEIRTETALARLEGRSRVEAAVLSDGTRLAVDLVLVGIGVEPQTELAAAAGLALDNGIAVDGRCATSDPAIFAAGDCASFPYEGRRLRLESVQNAVDQGAHAARAMLGDDAPYRPVPWFWSDQYNARLQIAGLGQGHDRIITRPGHRAGGRSFWYYRGKRLLAVDAVSDPKAYMQGRRWIEAGVSPDP
ncbi:MAG: FAD-dependent oxidoreductase, partial [Pseudomonadota bacterium]